MPYENKEGLHTVCNILHKKFLRLYFIIIKKQAEKLSLYLTGSFFQHKKYPDILDLNEFNVIQESPYFGKSSCSFTIRGEFYALGNCPESDSDPEKCFRLWKIGSTKVEPTEIDVNVDSEMFGWKCTSLDDNGHMLLVQNDGISLLEHFTFDENGLLKQGLHELKARDNNDLRKVVVDEAAVLNNFSFSYSVI